MISGFNRLTIILALFLLSHSTHALKADQLSQLQADGGRSKAVPKDFRLPTMNSISLSEIKGNVSLASMGPFEIVDADSSSKIQFQFAGQLWLMFESLDKGSTGERTQDLYMKARRIRLTLKGTVYRPELYYKLHISVAPRSLELMDFYFNYKINQSFQFRFGQYKTPFTRYRIQSFQRLAFIDWAIVTRYFGAERQMGFAFHNGYEKPSVWSYVLGVFTGVNARASHALGLVKAYCEETINPSNLADPAAFAKFQPELFFHLTHNTNNIQTKTNSDAERTGLRYSIGLSTAWDLKPTAYRDFSLRLAPEILVKYRGVSLFAAGYAGFSEIGDPAKTELSMTGGLFQTSYRIDKTYEIAIRYSVINFKSILANDAFQRAQRLIIDSGNNPDIIEKYIDAGQVLSEQEINLGFNIYIIGNALKWQNDIGWLRHSLRNKTKNDYLARSQFQLTI